MKFDICAHLHAMSDFGFASEKRKSQGYTYSPPHTHDAECYAEQRGDPCTRKGQCLLALTDSRQRIGPRSWFRKQQQKVIER